MRVWAPPSFPLPVAQMPSPGPLWRSGLELGPYGPYRIRTLIRSPPASSRALTLTPPLLWHTPCTSHCTPPQDLGIAILRPTDRSPQSPIAHNGQRPLVLRAVVESAKRNLAYQWSVVSGTGQRLDLQDPAVSPTGGQKKTLVVQQVTAPTYTVRVTATAGTSVATAQVLAAPPLCRRLHPSPQIGVRFSTTSPMCSVDLLGFWTLPMCSTDLLGFLGHLIRKIGEML